MLNRPVQSQRSRVGPGAVQAFRPFFLAFDTQMENSNGPARSREQDVDLWLSDRVHEQLRRRNGSGLGFRYVGLGGCVQVRNDTLPTAWLGPLEKRLVPFLKRGFEDPSGAREVFDTRSEFGSSEFGVVVVRLFFDDDKEKLGLRVREFNQDCRENSWQSPPCNQTVKPPDRETLNSIVQTLGNDIPPMRQADIVKRRGRPSKTEGADARLSLPVVPVELVLEGLAQAEDEIAPLHAVIAQKIQHILDACALKSTGSFEANHTLAEGISRLASRYGVEFEYEARRVYLRCFEVPGSRAGQIQARVAGRGGATVWGRNVFPPLKAVSPARMESVDDAP